MNTTNHEVVRQIQQRIIEYLISSHNIQWLHDDFERDLYSVIFNVLNYATLETLGTVDDVSFQNYPQLPIRTYPSVVSSSCWEVFIETIRGWFCSRDKRSSISRARSL